MHTRHWTICSVRHPIRPFDVSIVVVYINSRYLYCLGVTAVYNIDPNSVVPFFSGTVVSVYNYENKLAVNGAPQGSLNGTNPLCARVPDASNPAKLLVAPCFLPNLFAGDYWVLAAGPASDNYRTFRHARSLRRASQCFNCFAGFA